MMKCLEVLEGTLMIRMIVTHEYQHDTSISVAETQRANDKQEATQDNNIATQEEEVEVEAHDNNIEKEKDKNE